jgi:hypothetical protein
LLLGVFIHPNGYCFGCQFHHALSLHTIIQQMLYKCNNFAASVTSLAILFFTSVTLMGDNKIQTDDTAPITARNFHALRFFAVCFHATALLLRVIRLFLRRGKRSAAQGGAGLGRKSVRVGISGLEIEMLFQFAVQNAVSLLCPRAGSGAGTIGRRLNFHTKIFSGLFRGVKT